MMECKRLRDKEETMNDGVRSVRLGPGEGRPITLGRGGVVTMQVEGRDSGGTRTA
jgi:hypothetical protein